MVVYIAGKMTGLPDKGKAAFEEAENKLHELGFVVLNPSCLPDGMRGDKYMPICLSMVNAADMLVLLPGWESSPGAMLEKSYAQYQNKFVFTLDALEKEMNAWHKLLDSRFPNFPCQTLNGFLANAKRRDGHA